jgi:hypothetical protein
MSKRKESKQFELERETLQAGVRKQKCSRAPREVWSPRKIRHAQPSRVLRDLLDCKSCEVHVFGRQERRTKFQGRRHDVYARRNASAREPNRQFPRSYPRRIQVTGLGARHPLRKSGGGRRRLCGSSPRFVLSSIGVLAWLCRGVG